MPMPPMFLCRDHADSWAGGSCIADGCLDGVLSGPLPSRGFVAGTVGLVDVGDFGDKWVVGVGVCEHRAYRK